MFVIVHIKDNFHYSDINVMFVSMCQETVTLAHHLFNHVIHQQSNYNYIRNMWGPTTVCDNTYIVNMRVHTTVHYYVNTVKSVPYYIRS